MLSQQHNPVCEGALPLLTKSRLNQTNIWVMTTNFHCIEPRGWCPVSRTATVRPQFPSQTEPAPEGSWHRVISGGGGSPQWETVSAACITNYDHSDKKQRKKDRQETLQCSVFTIQRTEDRNVLNATTGLQLAKVRTEGDLKR